MLWTTLHVPVLWTKLSRFEMRAEQTAEYLLTLQAPQAGEAVEFLIEEGKPVEFREEIVSLAPFFGGHIIGDAKYS